MSIIRLAGFFLVLFFWVASSMDSFAQPNIEMAPSTTHLLRPTYPSIPSGVSLGVRFQNFENSVYVREVLPGGPASRLTDTSTRATVSLEPGDRVITINGTPPRDAGSAQRQIEQAGGNLTLEIISKATNQFQRLSLNGFEPSPHDPTPGGSGVIRQLGITMNLIKYTVGNRTSYGVKVMSVIPGSLASKMRDLSTNSISSIDVGEYIVAINGSTVSNVTQAHSLIRSSDTSIRVDLKDIRSNRTRSLQGSFSDGNTPYPQPNPSPYQNPYPKPSTIPGTTKLRFGIIVSNTSRGVQIIYVEPNSAATKVSDLRSAEILRLEPGDYLVSINGLRIQSAEQATFELKNSRKYMILEVRDGKSNQILSLGATLPY